MSDRSHSNLAAWARVVVGLLVLRGVTRGATRVTATANAEFQYRVLDVATWISGQGKAPPTRSLRHRANP